MHAQCVHSVATYRVRLRRAISLPAFIGAVRTALDRHPDGQLRRRTGDAWRRLEKTIGINLGVVAAGMRTTARVVLDEAEVLHDQLLALTQATDRLVVVFDEFQRLNSCPGEPLSIIRSALMEPDSGGRVSLLLTGGLREKLELMLHTDTEPIWDQTHDVALPPIEAAPFAAYLEHAFAATGKPIDERAAVASARTDGGTPEAHAAPGVAGLGGRPPSAHWSASAHAGSSRARAHTGG